jgi:DNA-binding IclR family transcriptional regulator
MSRADGKLFELLADEPTRNLLRALLAEEEPQTQRQLASTVRYNSSTISRRMAALEEFGVVERRSGHAPYALRFPSQTRALLLAAAGLDRAVKQKQADEAAEYERDLRKESLGGGHLLDRSKES